MNFKLICMFINVTWSLLVIAVNVQIQSEKSAMHLHTIKTELHSTSVNCAVDGAVTGTFCHV